MAELEGTVAIGEGFEVRLQAVREEARSMREYVEMRPFKFLHHFAGETDGLAEELMTMAQEVYMRVSMVSVDRLGLLAEEPYTTHLRGMLLGEYDAYHSGFPCSSFSRLRWKESPGLPKPVRSKVFIYGLPDNDERQQAEADRGTLMAVRSIRMARAMEVTSSRAAFGICRR